MSSVALRERSSVLAAVARACAPFSAWWAGRSAGDRRILAACAGVAGVLLVWAVLWLPAADGIATLERSLPELREQQRAVQALAAEVRTVRARTVSAPAAGRGGAAQASLATVSPDSRRTALQDALTRTALGPANIEAGDSPARWRLRWASVDYSAWLTWATSLERTVGVRVVQVNAEAVAANAKPDNDAAGRVMLDMEIEWPAS